MFTNLVIVVAPMVISTSVHLKYKIILEKKKINYPHDFSQFNRRVILLAQYFSE